jgi:hypothetical protein
MTVTDEILCLLAHYETEMKHRNFERLKGTRKTNKSSRRVDNSPGSYTGRNGFVSLLRDRHRVSRGFP